MITCQYQFETAAHQTIRICFTQTQEHENIDELLHRADDTLDEAKENKRNRVHISYEVL